MVNAYSYFIIFIASICGENIMSRTKRNISNIPTSCISYNKVESSKHLEELIHKFSYKCRCERCINLSRTKIVENLLKQEIKDFNYD